MEKKNDTASLAFRCRGRVTSERSILDGKQLYEGEISNG